jgi:hypothetical protein
MNYMKKSLKKKKNLGFLRSPARSFSDQDQGDSKSELERKMERGTDRAIEEYRKVFEKLAEYDRA